MDTGEGRAREAKRIEREIASAADRAHFLRDLLRSLGQPLKDGT